MRQPTLRKLLAAAQHCWQYSPYVMVTHWPSTLNARAVWSGWWWWDVGGQARALHPHPDCFVSASAPQLVSRGQRSCYETQWRGMLLSFVLWWKFTFLSWSSAVKWRACLDVDTILMSFLRVHLHLYLLKMCICGRLWAFVKERKLMRFDNFLFSFGSFLK